MLIIITTIHPSTAVDIPKTLSIPPIIGPTRKPSQNIAPMSPIFFVLFSGVEISEIYA
jgi:hypothetical protein